MPLNEGCLFSGEKLFFRRKILRAIEKYLKIPFEIFQGNFSELKLQPTHKKRLGFNLELLFHQFTRGKMFKAQGKPKSGQTPPSTLFNISVSNGHVPH